MANINTAINKNLIESILPTYGNPRAKIQIWDEGQKMFICDEYESASGHRYYKGVRFSNQVMIVEKVGLYHNWTYLDSLELYAYDETSTKLIQKKDFYKEFRSEEFVRVTSEQMVRDYISGLLKIKQSQVDPEYIQQQSKAIIDGCFVSFLNSENNHSQLKQLLPIIEEKKLLK